MSQSERAVEVVDLPELSELLKQRNDLDKIIAKCTGRPAIRGHLGELIASQIFQIELNGPANEKGSDGYFSEIDQNEAFREKSVNIKCYAFQQGILDLCKSSAPDYYLVLTGSTTPAVSSKGMHHPFVIENVYLFKHDDLISKLQDRVKIGVATSIRKDLWDTAQIYPNPSLTPSQKSVFITWRCSSQSPQVALHFVF